ncbi:APC family permease [Streptococcus suis]|uniref:APC family permease n=1 Tax=Streptococcus suis TaxID=1307 RepID=UPI001ABDE1C2|nr:APC family permease [Streptococcus suis]MBO4110700.1 APC family permease [Streptococcus suis]
MKKKLGFYSIVLLTINSVIGTGIFLSPGTVVASTGQQALLVYLLAAVFASVLAITFAAAAKYVSKGGAAYAYAKAAFGDNVGFYVGITRYIAASIAWGVMGTAVVKTVFGIFGLDNTNMTYITLGFICLMAVLLLVNIFGTRIFEVINNLSTIGKVGALVTTIVVGLAIVLFGNVNQFGTISSIMNSAGEPLGSNLDMGAYCMAIIAAFYAFTGFESVASGSEDMEAPEKNLPRAIPLAIAIVAAIYIGIVGVAMMINPEAIVSTTEVVALAEVFDNNIICSMIVIGALVSMFGINVAASFHTPRILEAMALQGQIPSAFTKRTENGFPLTSFLITIGIAILLPMAFGFNMSSIIVLSSISRFIQFIIVPLAVIIFYLGKERGEALQDVKKNPVVDVFISGLALAFTLLLLYKFSWAQQFTITLENGEVVANVFAITAMVIGYVILPIVLMIWKNSQTKVATATN